jgi:triacylglycerol lipase
VTEQLPPDVIARLTGMGSAITPELVATSWALLKPFHDKVGYTAPKVDRDLAYGPHERHRLDVHAAGDESGAPVFVFVHGGGFVGGDKHVPGTPMYDHIGAWAVRNGWVGVTITYRLAPEFTWPSGAEDVAAAVQWVRGNIAGYGGDPARIVVAGHSAGCVHVASYVAGQAGGDKDSGSLDGVKGAGLLSGFYQIPDGAERGELEVGYFGRRPAAEVNTLPGLLETPVPLVFAIAERDPQFSQGQIAALTAAWFAKKGTVPPVIWSEGHNHISQIGSVGVDDLALGAPLARFVNRVTQLSGGTTPRTPPPRRERDSSAPEDPRRGPPRDPGAVRLLRLGPEHR